jgi:Fe(3+) dicitrate transport protein
MSSLQLTYVSSQFTEASNSKIDTIIPRIFGEIPSYYVADFQPHTNGKAGNWKRGVKLYYLAIEKSYRISRTRNNPLDTRTFYTTLEFVF